MGGPYIVNGVEVPLTPAQSVTVALGRVQRYLDNLIQQDPHKAELALVAIDAAMGGPVKAGISYVANKGLEAALGEQAAYVEDRASSYMGHFIAGNYKTVDDFDEDAAVYDGSSSLIKDGSIFVLNNILGLGTGKKNASSSSSAHSATSGGELANNGSAGAEGKPKPKVTAEAEVDGAIFKDTNQSSRPSDLADSNKPTLIADEVQIKIDKSNKDRPNGNMSTAHAEIGAIQQAFDAGKTQGKSMTMRVSGEPVCTYCRSDIRQAADNAGLDSLSIIEESTGKTLTWSRREDGTMSKIKITDGEP